MRDSFLRASDDVIALMGNWDGYTDEEILRPGHDVHNILIEHSELSTSISNIVRAGWPRKIFNSRNFTLRNSDILHGGIGACGQTFGLLGFWGANGAKGDHSNYTFENLWLDNWYSLVQMEQEQPALHGFTFRNIWALDQPPLAGSTIAGDVAGVTFDNVKYGQMRVAGNADLPLVMGEGTPPAQFPAPIGSGGRFFCRSACDRSRRRSDVYRGALAAHALHLAVWRWNGGAWTARAPSFCGRGRNRAGWRKRSGALPGSAAGREQGTRGQTGPAGLGFAGRGGGGALARCHGDCGRADAGAGLAYLSRRVDGAARSEQGDAPSLKASRRGFRRTRMGLRGMRRRGRGSSMFRRTADTRFT